MAALAAWLASERPRHPELLRFGVFGSYGRGDAGVGSDLDLVAIVAASQQPFAERGRSWAVERLPVPAELLVYTPEEWQRLSAHSPRFAAALAADTRWIWLRADGSDLRSA